MSKYICIQRIFCIEDEAIDKALMEYPNAFSGGIAVVTYNDIYVENKSVADYEAKCRKNRCFLGDITKCIIEA